MKQKVNVMKNIFYLLMLTGIIIGGFFCDNVIKSKEPVLLSIIEDVAIKKNQRLKIDLSFVETYDINGDDLSIEIQPDTTSNYRVLSSKDVLQPKTDFVGDLYVPVKVADSKGNLSNALSMVVSVMPDIKEIMPIYIDTIKDNGTIEIKKPSWEFIDSFFVNGIIKETSTSRLEVTGKYTKPIPDVTTDVFTLEWTNLTEKVQFLFTNTETGFYRVGGKGKFGHQFLEKHQMLKYPVSKKDAWKYNLMRYKVQSNEFALQELKNGEVYCTAVDTIIEVPRGHFKCVEYSYSYELSSSNNESTVNLFGKTIPLP